MRCEPIRRPVRRQRPARARTVPRDRRGPLVPDRLFRPPRSLILYPAPPPPTPQPGPRPSWPPDWPPKISRGWSSPEPTRHRGQQAVPAGLVRWPGSPQASGDGRKRWTSRGTTGRRVLSYVWAFPGLQQTWTYNTQAQLVQESGRWRTSWQPAIVAPRPDSAAQSADSARAGSLPTAVSCWARTAPLSWTPRPVVRSGWTSARLRPRQAAKSAPSGGPLVKIDAQGYRKKVETAGPEAFVEAIVFRATAKRRPAEPGGVPDPGGLAIDDRPVTGADRRLRSTVIGTVGEATKEIVEGSQAVPSSLGDQVGSRALQTPLRRANCAARPGSSVQLVAAKPRRPPRRLTPSRRSVGQLPASRLEARFRPFSRSPRSPAEGLDHTLNVGLQKAAESVLSPGDEAASALVAIRPSTGAVLAVANGPGANGGQSLATVGQFPPGSTFKVVDRSGSAPGRADPRRSTLELPPTVDVDGRSSKLHDYPSDSLGRIDLKTAVAQSCNTASSARPGSSTDTALAAGRRVAGRGQDYDVGFRSFFGSVPERGQCDRSCRGADRPGQGRGSHRWRWRQRGSVPGRQDRRPPPGRGPGEVPGHRTHGGEGKRPDSDAGVVVTRAAADC